MQQPETSSQNNGFQPAPQTLSEKQLKVLYHLLTGATVVDAAQSAGVHRSSIYIWLQQDAFRTHYDRSRLNRARALADRLTDLAGVAQDAVRDILVDSTLAPTVRLRAAKTVFDIALQPLQPAEIRHNSTQFDTPHMIFSNVELETPTEPAPSPAAAPTGSVAPQPPKPLQHPNPANFDDMDIDSVINALITQGESAGDAAPNATRQ